MLAKIDQYFGLGIIHWEHEGEPLWGLVNSQGSIITFGVSEMFIYSLNRLFINYLVKTYGKNQSNQQRQELYFVMMTCFIPSDWRRLHRDTAKNVLGG